MGFHFSGSTVIWHIITSEYPPQTGGVSDYTQLVAQGLAEAGDEVHVWCPATDAPSDDATNVNADEGEGNVGRRGVLVHRDFGNFTRSDLRNVDDLLEQFSAPRRFLVQWVPHGYGYRSMNLGFCLWLRRRALKHQDDIEVMVHEPFLTFGEGSWRQSSVAAVHRVMTMVLLSAARRVWISIPAWEKRLRPYAFGRALPFHWLPVPSNIPVVDDPVGVNSLRARYAPEGQQIVGHFGTYDRPISELLLHALPLLLHDSHQCNVLLLGRGSNQMLGRLTASHPDLMGRVHAAGTLAAAELSLHLSACDLLLQPYVDGISSRRTSAMVGLAHGIPIVTTSGTLTEPLWAKSEAVALVPVANISDLVETAKRLLENKTSRQRMSRASHALYEERFDARLTINALRSATAVVS